MTTNLQNIRQVIAQLPVIGPIAKSVYRAIVPGAASPQFSSSSQYWEDRYKLGGNSGAGSYGRLADFKAVVINKFVADNEVKTVIEFGSGDGAQLEQAHYPSYTGVDVSARAVQLCQDRFRKDPSKRFVLASSPEADAIRAELAMSLDVIYHLVEDSVYDQYMMRLITAAERYICIYSSNTPRQSPDKHVRHRVFTDWMAQKAPAWKLISKIENPFPEDPAIPHETSWADFYFFQKS
ncbi:class I SAM-dependent methyltransferase [Bradyrhizobium niftali]|uniref:Class I SAM-dependent methyltransferase n=1 Tax=Bradyrhizobium niftali TaxID=2560055 RepID=A0A4Y9LKE2_9BRAD|nr:class I SAM-dependent methyltransferase [Bradyrhizobium niftali]TFV43137.1 class I SAM-dependent methyltransferase [Bradyrhizobium niftali]